jgi:hypothetical protein
MPDVRHRGSRGSDYAYLDRAGTADLAWEWLRRDAGYRQLIPSSSRSGPFGCQLFPLATAQVQRCWGCLNVAAADRGADANQLLWSAAVDPSVLVVAALPASTPAGAAFDLADWGDRLTIVQGSLAEHILVRPGCGQLRFDVCAGTILQGPVRLFVDVTINDAAAISTARLARFRNALSRDPADLSAPRRSRAHVRQIAALRTFDALTDGASIRDVAIVLFGEARVRAEWLDPSEALKSTCRRLIVLARRMSEGGYMSLLNPTCDRP